MFFIHQTQVAKVFSSFDKKIKSENKKKKKKKKKKQSKYICIKNPLDKWVVLVVLMLLL